MSVLYFSSRVSCSLGEYAYFDVEYYLTYMPADSKGVISKILFSLSIWLLCLSQLVQKWGPDEVSYLSGTPSNESHPPHLIPHLQRKKQKCRGTKQLPSDGTKTWTSTSGSRAQVHSHYGNFLFNMQSPLKYCFDHHCGFTDWEIWKSKM